MSLGYLYRIVLGLNVLLMLLAPTVQAEYKPKPYGNYDGSHGWGTHGYFRLGHGFSESDEQVCYRAPGAGAKYRLGNECEISIELAGFYHYRQHAARNAPYVHAEARVRFRGRYSKKIEYNDLLEAYVEVGHFTRWPQLNDSKIWLGRRNYDRHFIYINDYYYLDLIGDGGGIRDIPVGKAFFAYSYMQDNVQPRHPRVDFADKVTAQSHDFRLYDIPSNPNGRALLFWQHARINGQIVGFTPDSSATASRQYQHVSKQTGWATGLIHHQDDILGGYNKFSIQYGRGAARSAGADTFESPNSLGRLILETDAQLNKARTFRVTNHYLYDGYRWAMMTGLIYERQKAAEFDRRDHTWRSFGVRPMYFFTDNWRVATEFGYDHVTHHLRQQSGSLRKLTLVGELAQRRGFWTRPVFRTYITYAEWSDSLRGQIGYPTYADKTAGWSMGIQIESTW